MELFLRERPGNATSINAFGHRRLSRMPNGPNRISRMCSHGIDRTKFTTGDIIGGGRNEETDRDHTYGGMLYIQPVVRHGPCRQTLHCRGYDASGIFDRAPCKGMKSLRMMALAEALKEMLDQGCDDEASFEAVIAAFSDPAALDRYRISEPDAWVIDNAALRDMTMLSLLDREEQPRRLIALLQDRAEAGSPEAMTALGILGSIQFADWQRERDYSRERSRYKIRADSVRSLYPGVVDRFRIGNGLRWSTHPLERLYPDLPELAETYLQKASDDGFAPAHVIRLTGEMPEDLLSLC